MSEPKDNIYRKRKTMMFNNFLGGISWALGASVGLSLVVAILTFVAKHINFVPIVGNFVAQVSDFVATTAHH